MKKWILFLVCSVFVLGLGTFVYSGVAEYAGSETCAKCHPVMYNDWLVSGHSTSLREAEVAKYIGLPLPEGYTWDDIHYVIGGTDKKSRYVDKKGYMITMTGPNKDKPGKNQYNIEKGVWSDFYPGEKKPFCAFCHTTGYKEEGHQDGLEGIVGTWVTSGIHCERCHGAGKDHAATSDKTKISTDRSNRLCGSCHGGGVLDAKGEPLAKGGFLQHGELAMNCVTCHNPHKRAKLTPMDADCAACHSKEADDFKGSSMESVGKTCKDCHMPRATEGATRYHLFKINTDPKKVSMFYEEPRLNKDGKQVMGQAGKPVMDKLAKGFVTLDFACLNCHKNKDMKWAAEKAKNIHKYGKKT